MKEQQRQHRKLKHYQNYMYRKVDVGAGKSNNSVMLHEIEDDEVTSGHNGQQQSVPQQQIDDEDDFLRADNGSGSQANSNGSLNIYNFSPKINLLYSIIIIELHRAQVRHYHQEMINEVDETNNFEEDDFLDEDELEFEKAVNSHHKQSSQPHQPPPPPPPSSDNSGGLKRMRELKRRHMAAVHHHTSNEVPRFGVPDSSASQQPPPPPPPPANVSHHSYGHHHDEFVLKCQFSALIPAFDPRPGKMNINQIQDIAVPPAQQQHQQQAPPAANLDESKQAKLELFLKVDLNAGAPLQLDFLKGIPTSTFNHLNLDY